MKAVFLDTSTLGKEISLETLNELPLEWVFYPQTRPEETNQRIQDATVIVSNKVLLTQELLQQAPALKLICVAATGYNNVDLETAKRLGITVCNIPNYSTPSVVQLTLTFLLALMTNLVAYVEATREGRWQKSPQFFFLDYPIHEIQRKKLGIIGYGALGKQVATLAAALGMEVLVASHTSGEKREEPTLPLDQVLQKADVVTIHTPLTPQTKNLIQMRELRLMKPSAFLINTARGGIVNEKDLAEALKSGVIAGAAIDVLSIEPPSEAHPLLEKDIPNLLLTPHVGWASLESRLRLVQILKANIKAYLEGFSQNLV